MVGDSVKTHLQNVSAILKGQAGGQKSACDGRASTVTAAEPYRAAAGSSEI